MHVVVRTPSEEAELIVRTSGSDLPLADLIARVTGQPAPPVVAIDGRPVATSDAFASSGVVAGSVIELADASPGDRPPDGRLRRRSHDDEMDVVTLVQLAGTGAGTRAVLAPGEFQIGPGRRVTAPELDFAPVDESAIHLTVQEDGGVMAGAIDRPLWIDGRPCEPGSPAMWTTGLLEVGDRVFALRTDTERDRRPDTPRTVDADGRAPFNRPPLRRVDAPGDDDTDRNSDHPRPDLDRPDLHWPDLDRVLRMTRRDTRELWQRRATDHDAFRLPVGMAPEPGAGDRRLHTIAVDLQRERGFGIVGESDYARAAARGLLLHAATGFGPADLDIAVVTSPARLPVWEWLKWLPHTTVGDDPQLFSDDAALRAWTRLRTAGSDHDRRPPGHRTLVLVDEPARWHDRGSALRDLLADDDSVRYVVLGGSPDEIPAVCTTVLESRRGRGSVLEHFSRNLRIDDVHPFLAPEWIANDAARHLASLDDPELPPAGRVPDGLTLGALLDLDRPDSGAIAGRWISGRGSDRGEAAPIAPSAVIGRTIASGGSGAGGGDALTDRVECSLDEGGLELLVQGGTDAGTGSFLESLLVGMAIERQPDDLNLLLFDLSGRESFGVVAGLPHAVGHWVDPTPSELRRCVRCLRAELVTRRAPGGERFAHLVIALDEAAPPEPGRSEFVAELLDIVTDGADVGMHLVAATRRPAALADSTRRTAHRSLTFRLDATDEAEQAALPRFVPGRAVLHGVGRTKSLQTPHGFGSPFGARSPHAITPFVIGRDRGAMERRLVRLNALAPDRSDDPGLEAVVATLAETADGLGQHEQRRPCPAPLPRELELHDMLEGYPGDGVPYAIEDLPDEQRQAPRWWQPGPSGGLALIGGTAEERTALLITLSLGIAARASADDVHLYVVAATDADGRHGTSALRGLPHTAAVIGLDDDARLDAMVRYLDDEITRRADLADRLGGAERVASGEPAIAVLVDDVGELRERLQRAEGGTGILLDLERTIREGGPYGICAVVTAGDHRVLPGRLPDAFDLLVLPSDASDASDPPDRLRAVGLDYIDFSDAVAGRAIPSAAANEVQIAAPPDDIPAAIAELHAEPATERPPMSIPSSVENRESEERGNATR